MIMGELEMAGRYELSSSCTRNMGLTKLFFPVEPEVSQDNDELTDQSNPESC